MAKPYFHALSSAKKYGGTWEDYMDIHTMMDSSKAAFPDNRHRVLTHNSWFIGFILPRIFGETFQRKSDGAIVNTRDIGEQHVLEDYKMKFIPSASDFISEMEFVSWMQNGEGQPPASNKKIAASMVPLNQDDLNNETGDVIQPEIPFPIQPEDEPKEEKPAMIFKDRTNIRPPFLKPRGRNRGDDMSRIVLD